MKIAVSASEPDLNGSVDPRFGRSPYFLLIETDTMEFEAIQNFNQGQLHPAPGPNVTAHSGIGAESVPPPGSELESGFEAGRGSGFGPGMGYGRGRGMGPGKGLGFSRTGERWDFPSPEQELEKQKV